MKLYIDDTRNISEIQETFNTAFPYLKIEFFKKPHGVGEASPVEDILPADSSLARWRTMHNEGDLVLTKDSTVQEIESVFQNEFGISAQIFRRSGLAWLETSATDGWTLQEQNEQGEFMTKDIGE